MKKYIIILSLYLLSILSLTAQIHAEAPGGNGTKDNPFTISSAENLKWIAEEVNRGRGFENLYFIQDRDIDLSETRHSNDGGWTPIGGYFFINGIEKKVGFSGNYDGKDHVISNLYISRPRYDYQALFGYIKKANVKNLTLTNASVEGNENIAGLFAYTFESMVENCHVKDSEINSRAFYTGGLVGFQSDGIIKKSSVNASVTGHDYLGGLVGWCETGVVSECKIQGHIEGILKNGTAARHTGGIIGYCNSSSLQRCMVVLSTIEGGDYVGSFCGSAKNSEIKECVNLSKKVIGYSYVGGLVGRLNESQLTDSYTISTVQGEQFVGGVSGFATYSSMKIDRVYSLSSIKKSSDNTIDFGTILGGYGTGEVKNVLFDKSFNENLPIVGGPYQGDLDIKGLSTNELKDQYSFSNWDFDNVWTIEKTKNNGFPILRWQLDSQVNSITAPIKNELAKISILKIDNRYHIKTATNDIDILGVFTSNGKLINTIQLSDREVLMKDMIMANTVLIIKFRQGSKIGAIKYMAN